MLILKDQSQSCRVLLSVFLDSGVFKCSYIFVQHKIKDTRGFLQNFTCQNEKALKLK